MHGVDGDESARYACPCCGFLTLTEEPPGTYRICGVCWWEDDGVQFRDPNYRGGANKVRLNEARENFAAVGACEPRLTNLARAAAPDEQPE